MTPPKLLELDPHGDSEIILSRPNSQKLQWSGWRPVTKTEKRRERKKEWQKEQKRDLDSDTLEGSTLTAQSLSVAHLVEVTDAEPAPEFYAEPAPEFDAEPAPEFDSEPILEPTVASGPSGTAHDSFNESELTKRPPDCSGIDISATQEPEVLRLLVSSQHLRLASSMFRKMLNGPWRKGPDNAKAIREIRSSEWDAKAFVIILDIIHG